MKDKDSFITENLGLVHSCCKHFTKRGTDYDDLFQAGCVGLIKAVDGFDESRGLCFSTYAVPVILGEIKRLFRDGGAVKVSRSLKELFLKASREKEKMENELCRQVTVSELAVRLQVNSEELAEAFCAAQPTVSLTYESADGIKELNLPTLSIEEEFSDKLDLEVALEKLEKIERDIIKLRYFGGLTQSQTAKTLGMTQVQVSRKEKKILISLRECLI
ncbi:MAG: sigma-70 family RNA polymerase sigma factor [Ruminococcaceae bacterium]|nr:sigma-70 family RNA polymerase sigma factor [Oscillospiraceae bacterium]